MCFCVCVLGVGNNKKYKNKFYLDRLTKEKWTRNCPYFGIKASLQLNSMFREPLLRQIWGGAGVGGGLDGLLTLGLVRESRVH